jgi:hypothetical protein
MREFPLAVDNPESDIFIRRAGTKVQKNGLVITRLFDNLIGRRLGLVDKIWIENVELEGRSVNAAKG